MVKITYEENDNKNKAKKNSLKKNKIKENEEFYAQRTNFFISILFLFIEVLLWTILLFCLTCYKVSFALIKEYNLKLILIFSAAFFCFSFLLTNIGYLLKFYHSDQFSFNFSFLFASICIYLLVNLTNLKWYFDFGISIFFTILGLFMGTIYGVFIKKFFKLKNKI